MFSQNHRADFQVVLRAKIPYALVRFGDGELALIDGAAHKSADAWSADGPTWLKRELTETLLTNLDGFCLGLPPPCCLMSGLRVRATVRAPKSQQTFATLFMHGNLRHAYALRDRFKDAIVVSSAFGDIRVPADGVSHRWDVDGLVDELLKVERPILLAAGPCSNIIAYRYWKRQDVPKRQQIIDVGSVLDVLRGNINRHYHGKMNDHVCQWNEASRSRETTVVRAAKTDRVVLGRKKVDRPNKIQATPGRIKIGRH
jgi:hypothetical protein